MNMLYCSGPKAPIRSKYSVATCRYVVTLMQSYYIFWGFQFLKPKSVFMNINCDLCDFFYPFMDTMSQEY